MNWINEHNGFTTLSLYIVPRSSKTEIIGIFNDSLKIKIKALPVDNKANEELLNFLSSKLKLPRASMQIVSGYKQKKKVIRITGYKKDRLLTLLK